MKLVLAESKYLKDSISVISDLVTDVNLNIDKDKIELVATDPANVAMTVFKLLSSAFAEYSIDKPTKIAINLDSLKQVLRRAKPSDVIEIELDEEKNKLKLTLKGDSKRTFNISLLNLENQDQKVPKLNFPLTISIKTIHLDEAIEDAGIIGESVSLIADKESFIISSEGTTSNAKVEILSDDNTKILTNTENKIKAKYSVEYLKKMIKASKLADEVSIQFDENYPLKLDYLVKDKLSLQFVLAPRVQND